MAFAIVIHLVNHVVGTFKKHCLIMKNADELFLTEDFNGENKGKQSPMDMRMEKQEVKPQRKRLRVPDKSRQLAEQ